MEQIKEDIEICQFDGTEVNAVYTGGLSDLKNVTNKLKWRTKEVEYLGDLKFLKLSEIAEQLKDSTRMITIISESPLSGEIWQYGNYGDSWWKIGTICGYA